MRFGINTFLFTSPFTTASVKLFPQFKKWGFDTLELPVEAPEHIDPVKVKAAADKKLAGAAKTSFTKKCVADAKA
jgi:D-psicose/D-tagatose/L-ribulose 3-epimerase